MIFFEKAATYDDFHGFSVRRDELMAEFFRNPVACVPNQRFQLIGIGSAKIELDLNFREFGAKPQLNLWKCLGKILQPFTGQRFGQAKCGEGFDTGKLPDPFLKRLNSGSTDSESILRISEGTPGRKKNWHCPSFNTNPGAVPIGFTRQVEPWGR